MVGLAGDCRRLAFFIAAEAQPVRCGIRAAGRVGQGSGVAPYGKEIEMVTAGCGAGHYLIFVPDSWVWDWRVKKSTQLQNSNRPNKSRMVVAKWCLCLRQLANDVKKNVGSKNLIECIHCRCIHCRCQLVLGIVGKSRQRKICSRILIECLN